MSKEKISTGGVYRKVHNIMKKQLNAEKDGQNSHMKYKYTSFEEVLKTIRPALIEEGLVVTMHEKCVEIVSDRLMKALYTFTVIDVDSGEQFSVDMSGLGNDSINGDKNLAKACVIAMKYFYTKTFAITTGEDSDPEADSTVDKEASPTKPIAPQAPKTPIPGPKTSLAISKPDLAKELAKDLANYPVKDIKIPDTHKAPETTKSTKPSFGFDTKPKKAEASPFSFTKKEETKVEEDVAF